MSSCTTDGFSRRAQLHEDKRNGDVVSKSPCVKCGTSLML
jgi:hypothetical protein